MRDLADQQQAEKLVNLVPISGVQRKNYVEYDADGGIVTAIDLTNSRFHYARVVRWDDDTNSQIIISTWEVCNSATARLAEKLLDDKIRGLNS